MSHYETLIDRASMRPDDVLSLYERDPATINWLKELAAEDFAEQRVSIAGRIGIDPDNVYSGSNNPNIRRLQPGENPKLEYDNLDEIPTHVKAQASVGSRKMSAKVVTDLVRRVITTKDASVNGASNDCIKTMIYFCQINDNKGCIPNFRIKSLVGKTVVSERGAYSVLKLLESKKLIKVECKCNNGLRDITVLNNDFTRFDKKMGYLNLNRSFFNCNIPSDVADDTYPGFSKFSALSLYAKRLLLYILLKYDASGGHGYHRSIHKLSRDVLGIKNHNLIKDYIDELQPFFKHYKTLLEGFQSDLYTYKSKVSGSTDVLLGMRPNRCKADASLIPAAPTALKYQIRNIFENHSIDIRDYATDTSGTSADLHLIVEKLSAVITYNSLRCKNSPVTADDLIRLLEKFVCECKYFVYEHIKMFDIYIHEFVTLTTQLLPENYIMVNMA